MSLSRSLKSAALLGIFAIVGTALVAAVHGLTRERIAENERSVLLRSIADTFPPADHDNDILSETLIVRNKALDPTGPQTVYLARKEGKPVGAVLTVVAPNGYSGAIKLLVGVRIDGSLAGVRVVSHRETPGLGDLIDTRHSDWILGFAGRSIGDPPLEKWKVKRDGGEFDQFTGATISPRAVVEAVRKALVYFNEHRTRLFGPPEGMEAGAGRATPGHAGVQQDTRGNR